MGRVDRGDCAGAVVCCRCLCSLPPRFAGREVAVFSVDSADNSDECETGAASGSSSYSREAELSCARGESSDWPSSRW